MRCFHRLIRVISDRGGDEMFVLACMPFKRLYTDRIPLYWLNLTWRDVERLWRPGGSLRGEGGLSKQRRWFVQEEAAHRVGRSGGNAAKCGALAGVISCLICRALRRSPESECQCVFKSFAGLSRIAELDGVYWSAGNLALSEEHVLRGLAAFEFEDYKRERVPERFADVAREQFCCGRVDVDLAKPMETSLRLIFPRLWRRGKSTTDDCGLGNFPGAGAAGGNFFAGSCRVSLLTLPAGGAALPKLN